MFAVLSRGAKGVLPQIARPCALESVEIGSYWIGFSSPAQREVELPQLFPWLLGRY